MAVPHRAALGRDGEVCAGGGALKVFPGNLLLLQGEDKGCTDDGKHRQLVWCLSCCWWEGTHCAWTFPAFLPSLPAGEDVSVYPAVCGVDCCPSWLPVRHCELDWGRGDCAAGQGWLQLLLCAAPSSQQRTGCSWAANLP